MLPLDKRERLFDLAIRHLSLDISVETDVVKSLMNENHPDFVAMVVRDYTVISQTALEFNIELQPNLPNGESEEIQQFLAEQLATVKSAMDAASEYVKALFEAGRIASKIVYLLEAFGEDKKGQYQTIEGLRLTLRRYAQILDVDSTQLDDLIDTALNRLEKGHVQTIDILHEEFKIILCGGTIRRPEAESEKRSEVDETRVITDKYWCVSLVRLPDSESAEHAFLVIEGKEGRKSVIWFADLVAKDWIDIVKFGSVDGVVRLMKYETYNSREKLLGKCDRKLMEIYVYSNNSQIIYKSWTLPKSTVQKLIKNIEGKVKDPPKFNILGHESVCAVSSAASSSNDVGHNCFSFARGMLLDLGDESIAIPTTINDWVYAASSRCLVDKRRKWYDSPGLLLMVGSCLVAVVAFAAFKQNK